MTGTRARRQPHAFTLLELVLVLMILAAAMAMVAPSLRGWSRGAKVRDAGDQFLAVTRWARSEALANSQLYRINIDARQGLYWVTVQDGQNFVNPGMEFGRIFSVPEGFQLIVTDVSAQDQKPQETIDFSPAGRTQPMQVVIAGPDPNDIVRLECATPAEGFRLVNPQEVTR
jgi:prepilin-type N-terminal cleavage/methylation domain-containing protein